MIPPDAAPDLRLAPTMRWMGPGRSAFAGAAGPDRRGETADIGSPDDLSAVFGPGVDAAFARALGAYFSAGGGPCVVLNLPPIGSLPADGRAREWIGEDGGPGERTGVWALVDREDVGTIAAPGLLDIEIRSGLLSSLAAREDRFLLLDALPDGSAESLPPSPRAAVVDGWSQGADGTSVPPSGPALARLEASDFSEGRPDAMLWERLGPGHPTVDRSRFPVVEDWRLWEGLRRSIDLGTRWVIFEENGERLRRRIEREVGAFLGRLHRLGVLDGKTAGDAFSVRARQGDRPGEGLLVLEVEARFRGGSRRRERLSPAPRWNSTSTDPDRTQEA